MPSNERDTASKARNATIRLLARRERSRAELVTALKRRRFPIDVIQATLDEIEAEGLQSDGRFAAMWVENRRRLAPRSQSALIYELKQKGISDLVIERVLAPITPDDEHGDLRELMEARLAKIDPRSEDKDKIKRRLFAFLARRGFAFDDIQRVLREHFPQWV